jgi:hypothetical protein
MGFKPTRSRRLGHLILLTCGGENNPREASGDGVARSIFNGGGSSFQQCSSFGDCSDGGGVGRGSSSKRGIGARDSGVVTRWWWRQWRREARFGVKSHGEGLYLSGNSMFS